MINLNNAFTASLNLAEALAEEVGEQSAVDHLTNDQTFILWINGEGLAIQQLETSLTVQRVDVECYPYAEAEPVEITEIPSRLRAFVKEELLTITIH